MNYNWHNILAVIMFILLGLTILSQQKCQHEFSRLRDNIDLKFKYQNAEIDRFEDNLRRLEVNIDLEFMRQNAKINRL